MLRLLIIWVGLVLGGTSVNAEERTLVVGIVGGFVQDSTMTILSLVQNYVSEKIMPPGWKLQIRPMPSPEEYSLLRDVSGGGLYRVASMLDDGNVTVLVGPGSSTQTKLMHAFAAGRHIPHLPPFATDPALGQSLRFPMLIRLSPPDTFQTEAVCDIIQFYGWNRVSMITTDDDYGFGAASALLAVAGVRGYKVEVIERLQIVENVEDVPVVDTLDRIQALEAHPVVLVTGGNDAKLFLRAAYVRRMTASENWFWILMDGAAVDDVLTVTGGANQASEANFLNGLMGTRPIMSQGRHLGSLVEFWKEHSKTKEFPWMGGLGFAAEKVSDAILCVADGFNKYWQQEKENADVETKVDGELLRDAILRVDRDGFASRLAFDERRKIKSTEYDILIPNEGHWEPIGKWSSGAKLNMTYALMMNYSKNVRSGRVAGRSSMRKEQKLDDIATALGRGAGRKKPVIHVVTIVEDPFVTISQNETTQKGLKNRVFAGDIPPGQARPGMDVWLEGYCIEMLQKLSETAGFRYTLRLVEDSHYGSFDPEAGLWNGMIGDVVYGKAHVAVASITVTEQRAEDVDFATSFMDIGLKYIVDRKVAGGKTTADSDAFAFLLPFHFSLCIAIVVCVVCLAIFLHLLSRLSPYGARGHFFLGNRVDQLRLKEHPGTAARVLRGKKERSAEKLLKSEKADAERAMGVNNALYFVWASLFWQTPERVPRAPSARILTAVWYLSAVVFVAAYTANMVAFVSMTHQVHTGLDSVSDLVSQMQITYGTVSDSSVEYILSSSGIKVAAHIYNYIQSDRERHMVATTEQGLERVRNGSYALLWDSMSLDYSATESNCELKTVDVGFGAVLYAFAVKKGSALTPILSQHILKLRESGFLTMLWKKYFSFVEACDYLEQEDKLEEARIHRLTFSNLAGVFYLVFFAMAVGLPILVCEWISAGFLDVNRRDPHAPQTIAEALRIRMNRVKQDITENWVPLAEIKKKWSTLELPSTEIAQSVIEQSLRRTGGARVSTKRRVDDIRGYASEDDLTSLRNQSEDKNKSAKGFTQSLRRLASSRVLSFHARQ